MSALSEFRTRLITGLKAAKAPSDFRTCPITGLKVYASGERLIKANAVVAVVFFLFGLAAVIPVLLNRTLGPEVVSATTYYAALFIHGWNMLTYIPHTLS